MLLMVSALFAQVNSYSLKVGDMYEINQKSDITTDQEVMGSSQQIIQQINALDMLEVVAIKGTDIELKYTTKVRKMVMEIPMAGEQKMDSEGSGPMDGAFKALVNRSVNFVMDQYGNIKEFKGVDEVQSAIRADLNGTPVAAQADQLVAAFSEDVLKSTLKALLSIYSGDDAKEWNKNFSALMNQLPVNLEMKMWYDSNESILADGKVMIKGEIEQMGMTVSTDLTGIQNTIYDVTSNGIPSKIQTKQEAEGIMNAQGMEIPMKMSTKTTVTFTKK